MKKLPYLLLFLLLSGPLPGQGGGLELRWEIRMGAEKFQVGERVYEIGGEETTFEKLRFYAGHLTLLSKDEVVWRDQKSHRLVDASDPNSLSFPLDLPPDLLYDAVQFQLGVDSLTNVSGAFGGDLDPTRGMYWAWNSGYVNFKLEGSNALCPTRKHAFQFHLGGYLPPNQSVQNIRLPLEHGAPLVIRLDIARFLNAIELSELHTVMSPGPKAAELSKLASTLFSCGDEK